TKMQAGREFWSTGSPAGPQPAAAGGRCCAGGRSAGAPTKYAAMAGPTRRSWGRRFFFGGTLARGAWESRGATAWRTSRRLCSGMPYLAPLWTRRPVVCLVNHVHTELWRLRFPEPFAAIGRRTEAAVMPWVHRNNLFLTVSASTFAALADIGVDTGRIRLICN